MTDEQHTGPAHPGAPPEMRAWLDELAAHERGELERTWHLSALGREPEPDDADTASAWDALAQAMDAPPMPRPVPRPPGIRARAADRTPRSHRLSLRMRRALPVLVPALAVVVLFAVGAWWWMRPLTVAAPTGTTPTATILGFGGAFTITQPKTKCG